jgi:hypothetical protein
VTSLTDLVTDGIGIRNTHQLSRDLVVQGKAGKNTSGTSRTIVLNIHLIYKQGKSDLVIDYIHFNDP